MASKGNRPGFFDTFRYGWAPAKRAGSSAGATTTRAPTAGPPAGAKPARGRRPAAGKNGARAGAPTKASPALVKRKDELAHRFAELQWDLGGIAYEMARRDHYRLEVLNAQAAKLQEVDAELGQIERMLKLDEAGAAGTCPACGAMQARGAMYCWHCGKEVKLPTTSEPKPKAASKPKGATATTSPKPKPKPKRPAKGS